MNEHLVSILIIVHVVASIVNVTSGRTRATEHNYWHNCVYAPAEDLNMHSNVFVTLPARGEMCMRKRYSVARG